MTSQNNILTFIFLVSFFIFSNDLTKSFSKSIATGLSPEKSKTINKSLISGSSSIELTSFVATIQNNQVFIAWKTNNERNNSLFILEKSSNGSMFREITKVTAAGNSNSLKEYSFKDSEIPGKITYYRLTHVNPEGISEHSEILALSNDKKTDNGCIVKTNPDPCLGKCNIIFSESKNYSSTTFHFSMFDFLGNALQTCIKNQQKSTGLEFDTYNYLKPGIFLSKTTVAKNIAH